MKDWLIPCGIPAVLLGVSFGFGFGFGDFPLVVGVAAFALLALAAVDHQVRRPRLGLTALVVSAVALPVHFGPADDLSLAVVIAAVVCGCWLASLLVFRAGIPFRPFSAIGLASLLVAAFGLSAAFAQLSVFPVEGAPLRAQAGGLLIVALSVALFACASQVVQSVRDIRALTWTFLLAGSFVLLMYRPGLDFLAQRTTEPSTVGSVFWCWLVAMSLGQALFNTQMRLPYRTACLLLAIVSIADAIVVRPSWASGWLPPLIAVIILIALRFPRISLVATFVAMPLVSYVLPLVFEDVMATERYSWLSRKAAWDTLWELISASPLLGLGAANYYHFTNLFSTLGWYVKFSSHSQYIDLVAQAGFVGLTIFLAFAGVVLRSLWRLKSRVQSGFERAFVAGAFAGALACLASGMLADWLLPFVYNIGLKGFRSSLLFWLFLGLAMALNRIYEPPPPEAASSLVPAADSSLGELPLFPLLELELETHSTSTARFSE